MFWTTSPSRLQRFTLAAAMFACAFVLPTTLTNVAVAEDAASAPFGPLNPANWKMPNFRSMLPGEDEKVRIKKKKDGLFQEVSQSAANSWARTKEVFNPQKLNPVQYLTASSKTPSEGKTKSKPGFFQSLFSPLPAESENSTVTDFLRQPRPEQ